MDRRVADGVVAAPCIGKDLASNGGLAQDRERSRVVVHGIDERPEHPLRDIEVAAPREGVDAALSVEVRLHGQILAAQRAELRVGDPRPVAHDESGALQSANDRLPVGGEEVGRLEVHPGRCAKALDAAPRNRDVRSVDV